MLGDVIESWIRRFLIFITNYMPVKVIRDDNGVPFLYRYHIFSLTNDGPGLCIHRFVKSDPERGYHDHPWKKAVSFILCGRYDERIMDSNDPAKYVNYERNRWTFNWLDGVETFHRVMVAPDKDVWTIFAFQKRSKTWGMVSLDGQYKPMSTQIEDNDGGWWRFVQKGLGLNTHLTNVGNVICTVDIMVFDKNNKILLIKRGKDPFKDCWAFPGGRIDQKDDDISKAAYRELKEETNISDVPLKYHVTIGNNSRDPRGFCLTNVFVGQYDGVTKVKAGDDAVDFAWFDVNELPEMAFDHKDILKGYRTSQTIPGLTVSSHDNFSC